MDNRVQVSSGIAGQDAAMTGVMNALGQDGQYTHKQMPIKNRVNGLDVSQPPNPTHHLLEEHKRGNQDAQ